MFAKNGGVIAMAEGPLITADVWKSEMLIARKRKFYFV
jgi:hypothetical protein